MAELMSPPSRPRRFEGDESRGVQRIGVRTSRTGIEAVRSRDNRPLMAWPSSLILLCEKEGGQGNPFAA